METRRLTLFLFLSMFLVIGWTRFVAPLVFPQPAHQAKQVAADKPDAAKKSEPDAKKNADDKAEVAAEAKPAVEADPAPAVAEAQPKPEQQPVQLMNNPSERVLLGSLDPKSGYFLQAELVSEGAAVREVRLNDPRYTEAADRSVQLRIVGNSLSADETLQMSVPTIDAQLAGNGESLRRVNWKVVDKTVDPASDPKQPVYSAVVFEYRAPDGSLDVHKRFSLEKVDLTTGDPRRIRDTSTAGYLIRTDIAVKNIGQKETEVAYVLQGPVGLPLENIEHTRRFRDVRVGFLRDDESGVPADKRRINATSMTASKVVEEAQAVPPKLEEWKTPFQFIGVDVQYFAALIVPLDDQLAKPYIDVAQPMVVTRAKEAAHSDISVRLTSRKNTLKPGEEFTHQYSLFAGPKREALLTSLRSESILDFGYFGFVAKPMLALLNFFHNSLAIPYGIAIILLTVIVRGCMYPVSRKQALGAKKMKELQPKIQELRKKYGNDKEKMARAQMELFSKHNYNPFAGCLPIFFQMPVFIGLYTALQNSVDLRMASFLWIDNLAAPDALFRMPFEIPILGRYLGQDFNLLPIVTVCLFVLQQKMFMPPPTDKEQELQYKMMNFMMIFMGFMFYHVPAGLCVYFIASSLWGIGERKMLDWTGTSKPSPEEPPDKPEAPPKKAEKAGALQQLWDKLLAAADAGGSATRTNGRSEPRRPAKDDKRKTKSR